MCFVNLSSVFYDRSSTTLGFILETSLFLYWAGAQTKSRELKFPTESIENSKEIK